MKISKTTYIASITLLVLLLIYFINSEIIVSSSLLVASNSEVRYDSTILQIFEKNDSASILVAIQLKESTNIDEFLRDINRTTKINLNVRSFSEKEVLTEVNLSLFDILLSDSRIDAIYYNPIVHGTLDQSAPLINEGYSDKILTSDAGVRYSSELFNRLNDNESWISIYFRLKNSSQIFEFFNEMKQKEELREHIRNISDLSENPSEIYLEIDKTGFYRLINDSRIDIIFKNIFVSGTNNLPQQENDSEEVNFLEIKFWKDNKKNYLIWAAIMVGLTILISFRFIFNKKKNPRIKLFLISIILLFSSIILVQAQNSVSTLDINYSDKILTSDAGVRYSSELFNQLDNNGSWISIYFRLKNNSQISEFFNEMKQKEELRGHIRNISDLSENPSEIYLEIDKTGFDRLINDSRIEIIYYSFPIYGQDNSSISNNTNSMNQSNYSVLFRDKIFLLISLILISFIIGYLIKYQKVKK